MNAVKMTPDDVSRHSATLGAALDAAAAYLPAQQYQDAHAAGARLRDAVTAAQALLDEEQARAKAAQQEVERLTGLLERTEQQHASAANRAARYSEELTGLREQVRTLTTRVAEMEQDVRVHEEALKEEHAKAEAAYARGLDAHAAEIVAAEARAIEAEANTARAHDTALEAAAQLFDAEAAKVEARYQRQKAELGGDANFNLWNWYSSAKGGAQTSATEIRALKSKPVPALPPEKEGESTAAMGDDVAKVRTALELSVTANAHQVPSGCWATGPATGDAVQDMVSCPGCAAIAAAKDLLTSPSAFSRMAANAGRVPGLEAALVEAKRWEETHRTASTSWEQMFHSAESERDVARAMVRERDTLLAGAREVEATHEAALKQAVQEREAARAELAQERTTHAVFQDAVEASAKRLEEKVARIESQTAEAIAQRNAARQDAEEAQEMLGQERQRVRELEALAEESAAKLASERGDWSRRHAELAHERDAALGELDDVRAAWHLETGNADALREQVATLTSRLEGEMLKTGAAKAASKLATERQGDIRCKRQECARERERVDVLEREVNAEQIRVTALESEVAEEKARAEAAERDLRLVTEAKDRAIEAYKQAEHARLAADGARQAAERRVRDAADRLTGILKGPDRKDPLELETCVYEVALRPPTHPAPAGLLEAVPVEPPPDLTATMGADYATGFKDGWVKRGARIRATYDDATKGGETHRCAPMPVRVVARVNESLDEAGVPREVPVPGGVAYSERERIGWLAEKAAKWDAAVERAQDTVRLGKAAYQGQSQEPEAQWLVPWDMFTEFDRELHMRQGAGVAAYLLGMPLPTPTPTPGPGGSGSASEASDAQKESATTQATELRGATVPDARVDKLERDVARAEGFVEVTTERAEAADALVAEVESVLTAAGVDADVTLREDDEESQPRTDVVSRVRWLVEDRERVKKQRAGLLAGSPDAVMCDCRRPARYGTVPKSDCTACGGSGYLRHRAGYYPTSTQAPELREAVGPFIPWARQIVEFWNDNEPNDRKTAWMGGHMFTLGHCRSLLAAYNATNGGASPDSEDAKKYRASVERAKDAPAMAKVLWAAWRAHPGPSGFVEAEATAVARYVLGLDTPPSGPSGGERSASASRVDWTPEGHAVRTNLGSASAPLTPESLAAMVEAVAPEEAPLPSLWPRGVKCWDDFRAGAREVLRLATSGHAPRVFTEARMVEVLVDLKRTARTGSLAEWAGQMCAVANFAARSLGLTLPPGPDTGFPTCPGCGHAEHWDVGSKDGAPHSYCSERPSLTAPNCGCTHLPTPGGLEVSVHQPVREAPEVVTWTHVSPPCLSASSAPSKLAAITPDGRVVPALGKVTLLEPKHAEPVVLGKGAFVMLPDVAARAVGRTAALVHEAQTAKAYVQPPRFASSGEDGCGVCGQKVGHLHLWHCVFRDMCHYQDLDGKEVRLPQPQATPHEAKPGGVDSAMKLSAAVVPFLAFAHAAALVHAREGTDSTTVAALGFSTVTLGHCRALLSAVSDSSKSGGAS